MNYSESCLVVYSEDEVEENTGNAGVEHVLEVVSEVVRRLLHDRNKYLAAEGPDDN